MSAHDSDLYSRGLLEDVGSLELLALCAGEGESC